MNFNKLAPWNWFKKEEELGKASIPIRREETPVSIESSLESFRRELSRLFDDFFRGFDLSPFPSLPGAPSLLSGKQWLKPRLDISASDKDYTLQVELPGITEKDIQIELSGDTLKIIGEKNQEKEDKSRDYYVVERSYGSFQRVLALPEDAKKDNINASFRNGVLTITIPRLEQAATPTKRIEVKTG